MTFFRILALAWACLPRTAGMTMKQPLQPAAAGQPCGGENAMANTYGFLRTASNNVGNTVEGVLGVEGSLTDMKKDLDEEYGRWMVKKKALLGEREKFNAEKSRLKLSLMQQKEMQQEVARIAGDVASKKAENMKRVAANKEAEAKRALDRKGMQEDIDALKCATKTIQQAQQVKLEAANQQMSVLKDQNRGLQDQVFKLNQEVSQLMTDATKQNITNAEAASVLLSQVEGLQNAIHGLEKELLAQAQLEETVERSRERLAKQSAETVRQRHKLTDAQAQCMANKDRMVKEIEASKRSLNDANVHMMHCQKLDGENQQLQASVNECIMHKRSER